MGDCRLDSNPDQTVSVIDGLPGLDSQFAAAIVGVSVILYVQLRAMIGKNLNNVGTSLVSRSVQCNAACIGLRVHIESEIQQQLYRFQSVFLRPLISNS